ncbi:MAG TPA: molybdopterin molybdotransferase MoeA [Peptococcaceae bacterium]|nr:molybdopterin molybdotransferase MoeA [Peptococcaceae bacterium]
MRKNISLEEAQELLMEHCPSLQTGYVGLQDSLGRVLAEDIVAKENIPPFARSPYDGYALRAEDTVKASPDSPVGLEIIEEVPAGYAPKKIVLPGTAVKILTGAPVPEGADAVIKFEETEVKDKKVLIFSKLKAGQNVVPAGEDVAQGDKIACLGAVISPPLVGLMASLGITEVPVYERPRIAIISTGDELLDVYEPLQPGKIRNSNSYTLAAYCRELEAQPFILATTRDKKEEVGLRLIEALEKADMVITTGGVSVGDYDVLDEAMEYIGAETLYWKIDIKPGSPNLAAVKGGKVILSLSGNPAAALVVFHLLGVPYIKKMAGRVDYLHPKIEVTLKNDFSKASPRRRFLRGKLRLEKGIAFMEVTGGQGNGVLHSMIGCNILAEIPAGSGPLQAGSKLSAFLLD